jgi:hypothetical protein
MQKNAETANAVAANRRDIRVQRKRHWLVTSVHAIISELGLFVSTRILVIKLSF